MQKALVSYVSWWHFYYFTYAGDTLCAGDTLEPPVPTPHGCGHASNDRAQTSCSARSSHARLAQHDAPRVMCSAFEVLLRVSVGLYLFDVQTSLTVVYVI